MLIVVSGTHASGKSTLISDFAHRHPEATVGGDIFDLVDEDDDRPSAGMFATQLRAAADRILSAPADRLSILERGPLDFLAYLLALEQLSEDSIDPALWERARHITARAMERIVLLVVLPLSDRDSIHVADEEDTALRSAMNLALLDLIDERDLIGSGTVLELSGTPEARAAALEDAVIRFTR
ncbi:AAA family ATPase [Microbacterium sp. ZW T5_56]|uniref:AAA family ATPase n=1 Tax=Microbacterium sp. ZW T5_56 TaxID=3378081 RepID=UPI003851FACD